MIALQNGSLQFKTNIICSKRCIYASHVIKLSTWLPFIKLSKKFKFEYIAGIYEMRTADVILSSGFQFI